MDSRLIAGFIGIIYVLMACNSAQNVCSYTNPEGYHFSIEKNDHPDLPNFCKKVEVWGIPIYAVDKVDDLRLLHAANIMAEYLDNDEDGAVDNPLILEAMLDNKAFLVMWKRESDLNIEEPQGAIGQDLGNDETMPDWHNNGHKGRFDASLEEVLHLITHAGWATVYPEIFGEKKGTVVAQAMDQARGGQFMKVPARYPASAWYHYDDRTCDYGCMITEYVYWAMTSMLGAQAERAGAIAHEWELGTPDSVKEKDVLMYKLLTNPEYKFPTRLPDGKYLQD